LICGTLGACSDDPKPETPLADTAEPSDTAPDAPDVVEPDITAPDTAQPAPDLGPPPPPCTPTDTLSVHANIHTAGVIGDADSPLTYRPAADATWRPAHPLVALPDGRWAGSLFGLQPETTYDVQVDAGCVTFTTRALEALVSTATTVTVTHPASIQAALDAAQPGTRIEVGPGVYREALILKSGADGAWIHLVGQPGAILDGSTPDPAPFQAAGAGTWSVPWTGDPSYLARDGIRLYHYQSMDQLQSGVGKGGGAIGEGWIVADGTLWVRSATDPAGHTWQLPQLGVAMALDGVNYIAIEGFEIRYYGEGGYPKGIDVRGSDHVVVRNNTVHNVNTPIWVRKGSDDVRVEGNLIHQSGLDAWPWAAKKGTDHENSAIVLSGGQGAIARDNRIHTIFNGIYSGSFDDDQNVDLAFDVDVYDNRIANVGDDGLEPEGACINNRFHNNVVDTVHNGVSLAPITWGPTWVIRNRFTDYTQSGFKVSNSSSGPVFIYHNTCWTDRDEQNGMSVSGPFSGMVFRNNIVRGTRYALEMTIEALSNDLDYDNFFTTRGAPVIKWSNVKYDDLEDWCTVTGLECNGQPLAPGLVDPASGQLAPAADSPNVDAGVLIEGINDDFKGTAPDIGYRETGDPEVPPLPF